jgi:hypothetical protein
MNTQSRVQFKGTESLKMDDKKERKENGPETTELADSEMEQVSGGFMRKIESKIPRANGGEDGGARG